MKLIVINYLPFVATVKVEASTKVFEHEIWSICGQSSHYVITINKSEVFATMFV